MQQTDPHDAAQAPARDPAQQVPPDASLPPAFSRRVPFAVKVGLGLALLAVVLLSFSIGRYPFTPELPLQTVWAQITDPASIAGTPEQVALFNIRLPRVLTVLLAGASLAVSGAAYQGMFKNPLVSPDTLGASAGASLGAVTALLFAAPNWVVQLAAFTGGMLAVALTVGLGRMVRYDAVLSLVLGGHRRRALARPFFSQAPRAGASTRPCRAAAPARCARRPRWGRYARLRPRRRRSAPLRGPAGPGCRGQ